MITLAIIVITVAISFYGFRNPELLQRLMMNPYMITQQGQYFRLIASGFIHRDHIHLLFNMFTFYFFGTAVEMLFKYVFGSMGGTYFIILYVMAIVVSDTPTLFKHRHNPRYNSLGASGAVSAVVFSFIVFRPLQDICIYGVLCFPGFILGIAYLVYSYVQAKRSRDHINHNAHLFGALFGILFCIVLYPDSVRNFIAQISEWKLF